MDLISNLIQLLVPTGTDISGFQYSGSRTVTTNIKNLLGSPVSILYLYYLIWVIRDFSHHYCVPSFLPMSTIEIFHLYYTTIHVLIQQTAVAVITGHSSNIHIISRLPLCAESICCQGSLAIHMELNKSIYRKWLVRQARLLYLTKSSPCVDISCHVNRNIVIVVLTGTDIRTDTRFNMNKCSI
jgi:hypothetical protein